MPELICQSVVKELLKIGISYEDQRSLVAIRKELAPNYISVENLYSNLWNLFREVVLSKASFKFRESLQNKIWDFSKEIKKPLIVFDAI